MRLSRTLVTLAVFAFALSAVAQEDVENLVRNFDFEEGAAGWSVWVEDAANAGVNHDVSDDEAFTGDSSYFIEIFNAGVGQRVELHQNPFVLEAGQLMIYALWIKADKIRPARMIVNHRAAPWTTYGSANINITDEWTEFWVEADINQDDGIVGIYLELKDVKGDIWIDRIRFYEGEYFAEEGLGEDLAVDPAGKAAATWGSLKAR